jgi:hypothetical protein
MVVKTFIFFSLVNYPCKNGVSISCLCTGVEIKWNNPWHYCKIIWSGHIPGNMGYGAPILLRNRPLDCLFVSVSANGFPVPNPLPFRSLLTTVEREACTAGREMGFAKQSAFEYRRVLSTYSWPSTGLLWDLPPRGLTMTILYHRASLQLLANSQWRAWRLQPSEFVYRAPLTLSVYSRGSSESQC